jgi:triacylglycerol lipase
MKLALSITLALTFILSASPVQAADYSKDPVLMVHGYFLPDFATWASIEGKLIDDGWPPEYLFGQTFDSVVGCNPNHAEAIAASVEMIRAVTGRDKVDLLTHSMGGLDCRYYIKYLCGYKFVKDVVMLAGANHGSVVACLDPLSCGAEQMCVGGYDGAWQENPFLADLNACDVTPGDDLLYTSIWTEWDEIIIPQENSILPGALNHELDTFAEHGTILLNEEAYEWVKTGLNAGGSNDVGPTGEGPCVTVCEDPVEPEPEFVEEAWDVVEPMPDVVEEVMAETIAETLEIGQDDTSPDDLKHPPEDTASDAPLPHPEVLGDGTISDHAAPDNDAEASGPLYYLPPTKAGGCTAGPPSNIGWWLLLGLALVSRRILRLDS